jgi:hypothetical protein
MKLKFFLSILTFYYQLTSFSLVYIGPNHYSLFTQREITISLGERHITKKTFSSHSIKQLPFHKLNFSETNRHYFINFYGKIVNAINENQKE